MNGGFNNFKNAFNGNYKSTSSWDVNQLWQEQELLENVHKKYLGDNGLIRKAAKYTKDIPDIKNTKDRMVFGCNDIKYGKAEGCIP